MSQELQHPLLATIRALHRTIRAGVLEACAAEAVEALSAVADDGEGDTIYAVDKVSEAVLVRELARSAEQFGGIVLVAEGLSGGELILPHGRAAEACRYRVIVDPIDGTRGLMYQKRPGWVLTGVAPNRGPSTRLSDIELAVQTELPLLKQHLGDELWAVRGQGARAERVNVLDGQRKPLVLSPSRASSIAHGYAMVTRFFPGGRDELAAIDDEIVMALLGPPQAGKALCFEEQYASSGGQLYELIAGHDRFVCDLRPLLTSLLAARGLPRPLCCHPYDLCTVLIAQELGVYVRNPEGGDFDAPLETEADVAWAGYANAELLRQIEPLLGAALARRNLSRSSA
jgi:fructose-1,6-bisphosphatase/inositol monophosphatase family enzyme